MKSKLLIRMSALLLVVSAAMLQAQDAVPPVPDPDLPQPIDFSFADELVMQSPFTRVVSFEQTYQLTGVAYIDGRPVATVLNKETKKSFVVSDEPNAQGWSLMAASAGDDLRQTAVEMMIGGEMISMHYGGGQLTPGGGAQGDGKQRMAGTKQGGGKVSVSALLGQDGKKLYVSLSAEGRDKFKELVRARAEKHPEMTAEQNSAYAQKVFARIKASDPGTGKPAKAAKTPKKPRQGA